MKVYLKVLVLAAILLYFFSPVDLAPGPIDDIIVILMGLIVDYRLPHSVKTNEKDLRGELKC